MILRNRDLNIQPKENDQQKKKISHGGINAATKRQAARIIKEEGARSSKETKDEPMAKRACKTILSPVIPDLTSALYINSSKKVSQDKRSAASSKENELSLDASNVDENERALPNEKQSDPVAAFDAENMGDMTAMSEFAADIFRYYKFREKFFRISDYPKRQPNLEVKFRASLVDWLIEMQETFELNHETLYLAVKLFDLYMDRSQGIVPRHEFHLATCVAVFIAAKYDERAPPLIDDLIYMTEESFSRDQFMAMERQMLNVVGFDLGAPLSYRFLRRYARIAKEDMGTLTLGRYILETSLMSFNMCRKSESLIAIAALLLAKRMKGSANDWFIMVAQKSSGYKLSKIEPLMWELNTMIVQRGSMFPDMENVFRKYSHEIFFEVAKVPPLASMGPPNTIATKRGRTRGSS